MTPEELNIALYDKMNGEMQTYTDYLQTLSPWEILKQCHEYVTKFDILSIIAATDLPADQARALLYLNTPLDAIYLHYDSKEINHLDSISDAICEKAAALKDEYKSFALEPVYPHSLAHAQANNTVDEYIASHKLNVACKEDIDAAIKDFYFNNSLDEEAVRSIVEKYGIPRTMLILRNTMEHRPRDDRFSEENRSWANTIALSKDTDLKGTDHRLDFVLESHPGLVNIFASHVRKLESQQERPEQHPQRVKPSIREKIRQPVPQRNAPKISAHKKRRTADHGRA